jgi:hypothetical protein
VDERIRSPAANEHFAESKPASAKRKRRIAGGAATASGMNFQAAVTAIATILTQEAWIEVLTFAGLSW